MAEGAVGRAGGMGSGERAGVEKGVAAAVIKSKGEQEAAEGESGNQEDGKAAPGADAAARGARWDGQAASPVGAWAGGTLAPASVGPGTEPAVADFARLAFSRGGTGALSIWAECASLAAVLAPANPRLVGALVWAGLEIKRLEAFHGRSAEVAGELKHEQAVQEAEQ